MAAQPQEDEAEDHDRHEPADAVVADMAGHVAEDDRRVRAASGIPARDFRNRRLTRFISLGLGRDVEPAGRSNPEGGRRSP